MISIVVTLHLLLPHEWLVRRLYAEDIKATVYWTLCIMQVFDAVEVQYVAQIVQPLKFQPSIALLSLLMPE